MFFHSPEQEEAATEAKAREQAHEQRPVVTLIEPAQEFYEAEDYHQQFLEKRGRTTCHAGLRSAVG